VWVHDAGDSFRTERYASTTTREKLDEQPQVDFDTVSSGSRNLRRVVVPLWRPRPRRMMIARSPPRRPRAASQTVIVSGAKDFYQPIGPRRLKIPVGGPGAVEEIWVDESNASDRLGVPPRQVVDYLALVGDSSDNVPGVKGIGDKGARELLAAYPDLEAILSNAAEVKAKRAREALLAYADNARLSKELVTIQKNVPVTLDLERFGRREPDREALLRTLAALEFHALARRMGLEGGDGGRGGKAERSEKTEETEDGRKADGRPADRHC
jgi:DNA polymerase-1